MRFIHLICVGNEKVALHLAGLSGYAAHEVVLFGIRKSVLAKELQRRISDLGTMSRVVLVSDEYRDAFEKANEEISGLLADDICVGINMSTGSRIVSSAIEDALRIQLADFHSESGFSVGPACSAFRYYIEETEKNKIAFRLAPIWNTSSPWHNAIVSTLMEQREHLSQIQIWRILVQLGEYPISYEAFRKIFRGFSNWAKNLPCFKQRVERGQRYMVEL